MLQRLPIPTVDDGAALLLLSSFPSCPHSRLCLVDTGDDVALLLTELVAARDCKEQLANQRRRVDFAHAVQTTALRDGDTLAPHVLMPVRGTRSQQLREQGAAVTGTPEDVRNDLVRLAGRDGIDSVPFADGT